MKFLGVFAALALASGVDSQESGATPSLPAPSSFSCHGRPPGYYADLETGCKAYHVCDGISHFTYICPRRTLFQQRSRICDHSYLVRCGDSPSFFEDEEEALLRLAESEESAVTTKVSESPEENFSETYDEFTSTTPLATEETEIPTTLFLTTALPTKTPSASSATEVTKKPATEPPDSKEESETNPFRKFVKFRLKDFRSLFFIPELESNSIIAEPEKELVLPVERNDVMTFRNRKEDFGSSSCPSHCNPKFFLPGTCHPCIMIK